jgi:hypothetical protein
MPLIRYSTEDMGRFSEEKCGCCGLPVLELGGRELFPAASKDRVPFTEKGICEAVFADENILQFHLYWSGISGGQLDIVKSGKDIDLSGLIERLCKVGLDKVTVSFRNDFARRFKDKFKYVSVV